MKNYFIYNQTDWSVILQNDTISREEDRHYYSRCSFTLKSFSEKRDDINKAVFDVIL